MDSTLRRFREDLEREYGERFPRSRAHFELGARFVLDQTSHAIRWNDDPNLRGGPYEARIQKLLERPVSWSAAHIKGDGKKTWADVATEKQEQEQKK